MKKRARVHPLIAITAIIALTAMAITQELLGEGTPTNQLKLVAASLIFWLLGIKMRNKLPLT